MTKKTSNETRLVQLAKRGFVVQDSEQRVGGESLATGYQSRYKPVFKLYVRFGDGPSSFVGQYEAIEALLEAAETARE